jgi:ABC-type dipeptide/oligopeptide/nickel transport system permease subunit
MPQPNPSVHSLCIELIVCQARRRPPVYLSHPAITLFPGLAIFLVVLGFNLLGDGLRDALDPRMQQM